MHKLAFALGAAAAGWIVAATPSAPAHALVLPASAGLADAWNIEPAQNVAYVCRYGYYGRVCSWRPGPYYSYGYAPYRAYGYAPYRPYYRPYWRYGYRRW